MQLDVTWLYDDLEGHSTALSALSTTVEVKKEEEEEKRAQLNWLNTIPIAQFSS